MPLTVTLPSDLEQRVRRHVESGAFGSSTEVIREALRLFDAYQGVQAASEAALKADLAEGLADIEAGRVRPLDMADVRREGRASLRRESA